MSGFFKEVQRRKVYRVAAAYMIAAGFLIQIASGAFPAWELPKLELAARHRSLAELLSVRIENFIHTCREETK